MSYVGSVDSSIHYLVYWTLQGDSLVQIGGYCPKRTLLVMVTFTERGRIAMPSQNLDGGIFGVTFMINFVYLFRTTPFQI